MSPDNIPMPDEHAHCVHPNTSAPETRRAGAAPVLVLREPPHSSGPLATGFMQGLGFGLGLLAAAALGFALYQANAAES